jgi:tripartite-type tricarboxylate transporter receptor subunit TctC
MHTPTIKSLLLKNLGIMLAFAVVPAVSTAVLAADSYPSKTVRIIAPTAPGGGQDMVARLMVTKL